MTSLHLNWQNVKKVSCCVLGLWTSQGCADFLEDNKSLKQYVFEEPQSSLKLGFSVTPVGIMKNKTYFGASLFQVHWFNSWLDWEILGLEFGMANARNAFANSKHFTVRTAPKIRLFDAISIGVLGGYELVTFPDVTAEMHRNRFHTPEEPYSSNGWIYGACLSLTFPAAGGLVRVTPMYYFQTYSNDKLPDGWKYYFTRKDMQTEAEIEQTAADGLLAIALGFSI